jgi:hypothetical protein
MGRELLLRKPVFLGERVFHFRRPPPTNRLHAMRRFDKWAVPEFPDLAGSSVNPRSPNFATETKVAGRDTQRKLSQISLVRTSFDQERKGAKRSDRER